MKRRNRVLVSFLGAASIAVAVMVIAPVEKESAIQAGRLGGRPADSPSVPAEVDPELTQPHAVDHPLWVEVDTPEEVRAVVSYCNRADREATGELREAAAASPDPLVAGNAIRALGRLRASGEMDVVRALLHDPRPRVRQEAVTALGKMGDKTSIDELSRLSRGEDETLRALAIQALGRLKDERARSLIHEIAADPGATARDKAFAKAALAESGRRR